MPYKILALQTENGYELLAWRKGDFSNKEVRRLTKKFRNDADVLTARVFGWERFFNTPTDMKKELVEVQYEDYGNQKHSRTQRI